MFFLFVRGDLGLRVRLSKNTVPTDRSDVSWPCRCPASVTLYVDSDRSASPEAQISKIGLKNMAVVAVAAMTSRHWNNDPSSPLFLPHCRNIHDQLSLLLT
jgi:hypothetical protein